MKNKQKNLEVTLAAVGKKEVERFLAVVTLGIVDAIKQQKMTPDEGDELFFVPLLISSVKKGGINRKLMNAIDLGTELRGLVLLKPDAIPEALNEMQFNALSVIQHTLKKNVRFHDWLVSYKYSKKNSEKVSRRQRR